MSPVSLPETSRALYELDTDFDRRIGLHLVDEQRITEYGLVVGQEVFDPSRHNVAQIDPASMEDGPNSQLAVNRLMPFNRLVMNIMVDATEQPPVPDFLAPLVQAKRNLMVEIAEALRGSMYMGDRARVNVLGSAIDFSPIPMANHFPVAAGSAELYEQLARISREGSLSVLISDFERLNPSLLPPGLIGIKVNHPLELKLPADSGKIPFGGTKESRTYVPKQLAKTNAELAMRHQTIVDNLVASGVMPVSVVFDPKVSDNFDVVQTDSRLAVAVRRLESGNF